MSLPVSARVQSKVAGATCTRNRRVHERGLKQIRKAIFSKESGVPGKTPKIKTSILTDFRTNLFPNLSRQTSLVAQRRLRLKFAPHADSKAISRLRQNTSLDSGLPTKD